MVNYGYDEINPWNPFIPTSRDIKRTEQLAKKNCLIAGVLSLVFLPIACIYLNRGVNNLKIIGYVFVLAFMIGMSASSEEDASAIGNMIGSGGAIAISVENIRSITEARKRVREKADKDKIIDLEMGN